MKVSRLIFLSLFALSLFGCSYDSENDFLDGSDDPGDPDVLVNYTDDVQPIIQNACIGCHASPPVNGAPFALVNFSQVNQRANGIISRISLQSGSAGAMPPSGRLPQATIDKVQQWINDGKLEN
ncbi:hypothetical protein [uncultured Winogradskyella sp.]|uniref:hypothetical protein n=1 Tax=uncultured Winogradskyella sp. TaxID=395353 RepID=UPI002634F654|nr:hypothetical protein [uncultured Winogradskyella sp.]